MCKNIPGKEIGKCKGPEVGQFGKYEELKEGSPAKCGGRAEGEEMGEFSQAPGTCIVY